MRRAGSCSARSSRAWVDEIPDDELEVHYAKAVDDLDDDDLSMLAAWHASLEVGQPVAEQGVPARGFPPLGEHRREALKIAAGFRGDEAFEAGISEEQALDTVLPWLSEERTMELAAEAVELYCWDRLGSTTSRRAVRCAVAAAPLSPRSRLSSSLSAAAPTLRTAALSSEPGPSSAGRGARRRPGQPRHGRRHHLAVGARQGAADRRRHARRSTAGIECFGREASAYAKRLLPTGARVRYRLGVEERDRYGRALAYVWLADGRLSTGCWSCRGLRAAAHDPAERGLRRPVRRRPRRARERGVGLWREASCYS